MRSDQHLSSIMILKARINNFLVVYSIIQSGVHMELQLFMFPGDCVAGGGQKSVVTEILQSALTSE